jgi:ATP-dependent protease ClpP protease subunit
MTTKDTMKDHLEMFHDRNIHIPSRSILLSGEINSAIRDEFLKNILILDEKGQEITIYISSEGGYTDQGKSIYDLIESRESHIKGIVLDEASISASFIAQACDERIMMPNSYMMLHIGEESTGGHPTTKKRWDKKYEADTKVMENMYLKRIKEKKPRYTRKQLQSLLTFDTILSPKEAIELGLADKIFGA